VAHDFNNLLQAVLFLAQGLRLRPPAPDALVSGLEEMEAHIKRGASLTRQLLVFSRPHAASLSRLDLNEVVSTSTSLLRRLMRENIHLLLDLSGDRLRSRPTRSRWSRSSSTWP